MIDVIKQTPNTYSEQSRDYQVLARLFTALYNSTKSYIDNMHIWEENIDNKLTTLRARTLNFEQKHQWEYDALDSAVSCFKAVSRLKGTKTAIEQCIIILMRSYKLAGQPEVKVSEDNPYEYEIILPEQIASIGVVQDLLDYIMPIGYSYRMIRYKLIDYDATTRISAFTNTFTVEEIDEGNMGISNLQPISPVWDKWPDNPDIYLEDKNVGYYNIYESDTDYIHYRILKSDLVGGKVVYVKDNNEYIVTIDNLEKIENYDNRYYVKHNTTSELFAEVNPVIVETESVTIDDGIECIRKIYFANNAKFKKETQPLVFVNSINRNVTESQGFELYHNEVETFRKRISYDWKTMPSSISVKIGEQTYIYYKVKSSQDIQYISGNELINGDMLYKSNDTSYLKKIKYVVSDSSLPVGLYFCINGTAKEGSAEQKPIIVKIEDNIVKEVYFINSHNIIANEIVINQYSYSGADYDGEEIE